MNILILSDSFKGSATSLEIGKFLAAGIAEINKNFKVKYLPVADGGEGTKKTILGVKKGEEVEVTIHDPLMRLISATFGWIENEKTAILEMSDASGLTLLEKKERNPLYTSTYGTGELINFALNKGAKKIFIGLGGSATNDAGVGMAVALGIKFKTKNNQKLPPGGKYLKELTTFDTSDIKNKLKNCEIIAITDVTNPLTGKYGASGSYAKQKGANADEIELLEENMVYFSGLVKEYYGIDLNDIPGSGAAGGIAGGLKIFCNARLVKGFEFISQVLGLENEIKHSDIIITGEGRIDETTFHNKASMGVALLAKKYNKPVLAVTGSISFNYSEISNKLFDCVFPICEFPMNEETAIKMTPQLLHNTGMRIAQMLQINYK